MMNADFSLYVYALLTIGLYIVGTKLSKKLRSTILNPFIVTLLLLVAALLLFRIPFNTYYQGNFPLNSFLGVSVVALAVPFYERLPQIRMYWKKIAVIAVISTVLTMCSGVLLAILLGANKEIVASLLSKSVTMPIAIFIAQEVGGNSAISAVSVAVAGIIGSAFGIAVLKLFHITHSKAIGLSMGTVSHALGTARAMEYSIKAGSYASVALVLCGLLSALTAPILFKFVLLWWF